MNLNNGGDAEICKIHPLSTTKIHTNISREQSVNRPNNSIYSATLLPISNNKKLFWCQHFLALCVVYCRTLNLVEIWTAGFLKKWNLNVNSGFCNCRLQGYAAEIVTLHFLLLSPTLMVIHHTLWFKLPQGKKVLSVCTQHSGLLFGATDLWPRLLGQTSRTGDSSQRRQCRADKHLKEVACSRKK